MALSAAFSVNSSSAIQAHETTYGATVNLALLSLTGVSRVEWTIDGTSHESMVSPTITPAGSPSGATASFAMPADPGDGEGRAVRIKCTATNTASNESATHYTVVGVPNINGIVPLTAGEETARSSTHGWIAPVNSALAGYPVSANSSTRGKIKAIEIAEHFLNIGDALTGLASTASGTGSGYVAATSPAGRAGVVSASTGTTTSGRTAITSGTGSVVFGSGRHTIRCDANVPTASDGTDTYTIRIGFIDSASAEPTDGAYFRYTHSVNSGKWECVTRSNSSETATDSGISLSAGTFRTFEVVVNATATSVAFYVDGTLVQTHTTNIPSGSGRETGYGMHIIKSAGTTARTTELDLITWRFEPTTAL